MKAEDPTTRKNVLRLARRIGCQGAHQNDKGEWLPCGTEEELQKISKNAETHLPRGLKTEPPCIGCKDGKISRAKQGERHKKRWEKFRERDVAGIDTLPDGGLVSAPIGSKSLFSKESRKRVVLSVKAEESLVDGCPEATQNITVNLKNRLNCVDLANYGPMNPGLPNDDFWKAKAELFKTTPEQAKTALCGNCAVFIQTDAMKNCIAKGIGDELGEEAWGTIKTANLGFCSIFDFKCAGDRTCDAWVVNGPITTPTKE